MTIVLSASQYARFECLRRGTLEYVHGFKQPPSASLRLGSRVHEMAEAWLRDGTVPDVMEALEIEGRTHYPGQILTAGLHLGPPPGTAIVEGDIEFSTPS